MLHMYTADTLNVCHAVTEEPPVSSVIVYIFGFELGIGSVDTVCDVINRHVTPWMLCNLHT